jgi:hypothetical protein
VLCYVVMLGGLAWWAHLPFCEPVISDYLATECRSNIAVSSQFFCHRACLQDTRLLMTWSIPSSSAPQSSDEADPWDVGDDGPEVADPLDREPSPSDVHSDCMMVFNTQPASKPGSSSVVALVGARIDITDCEVGESSTARDRSASPSSPSDGSRSRSRSRSTAAPSPTRVDSHMLPNFRELKEPRGLPGCHWWSTPLFHATAQLQAKMPAAPARRLRVESFCAGMATEMWVFKAGQISQARTSFACL